MIVSLHGRKSISIKLMYVKYPYHACFTLKAKVNNINERSLHFKLTKIELNVSQFRSLSTTKYAT